MSQILPGLTLYCIALGMVQLAFLLGLGRSETRAALRAERARTDEGWRPTAAFAIVPCLNEAMVIGPTVRALVEHDPGIVVVVVDDGSDDDTGDRARAEGGDRVIVVRRDLPDARQGKGPALNVALATVNAEVEQRELDPSQVMVIVMDADGRLSPGALSTVSALFADERVGGAQLGVRIRNRRDNVLATIQDCEFWGIAALGQMGRMRTRTVSLGGNGQFTRLSALRSIGAEPWSRALTEDLDLAITMAVRGWHLVSTPSAWVSQQGLTAVRPLIKQRTRWFQGHMTAATTRLGDVWRSKELSNTAVLEMTSYLLIPFFIVLPWSVLSQVGLVTTLLHLDRLAPDLSMWSGASGPRWLVPIAVWYVFSFAPTVLCGCIYARRERSISIVRAVAFSHLLVLWNYVLFTACWLAVYRMVRGRTGWDKTARVTETCERASGPSSRTAPQPAVAR